MMRSSKPNAFVRSPAFRRRGSENRLKAGLRTLIVGLLAASLSGCTVHPQGESAIRAEAQRAAPTFMHPVEERHLPDLTKNASPDDLVRYALLNNADLERQYWDWRAAIEQIPQEGTQKTNVMITFNSIISNGSTSAAMNSLGLGNDAMNNIILPNKLYTAANKALDDARTVGIRFDKARFDLRNKVLDAYYDYALTAEDIRLEQRNAELLQMTARIITAHSITSANSQQDILKAANELDMSHNTMAMLTAKLPGALAALNALLNRPADAPLDPPAALPVCRPLNYTDAQLAAMAARTNPELRALAQDMAAKTDAIKLAKLEYLPEFGVNASTDLAGMAQTLTGSVMLPFIRYQGINAAIDQASANFNSVRAMRQQTANDVRAQLVLDLALLRDAQRQIDLLEKTIIPRARNIISRTSSAYATGSTSMLDTLDAQRALLALEKMAAELRIEHEIRLVDIETITGTVWHP